MRELFKVGLLLFLFLTGVLSARVSQAEDFSSFELNVPLEEVELRLGQGTFEELSPLYGEILAELGRQYETIGQRQARQVLDRRNGFYLGGFNNVGFSYNRRMSSFDINVQRQLAPDLFDDDRWIVTDQLEISIDASRLMSQLRDDGLINMSEAQHALFAGIKFKRSYRHIHFAESFQEGLILDMNKLFMSFRTLRTDGNLALDPYEIIQRDDYLSASVGALAMGPIGGGAAASFGALGRYHHLAKVEVQSIGPLDQSEEGERLRISFEQSRGIFAGIHVGVHAEFLRFLRLTLLSYDFTYSLEQTQRTHLSFDELAADELRERGELSLAVADILRGRTQTNFDVLAPHIVSHEQRMTERRNSRYMVFLFGGHREQETEYIEIVRDGLRNSFIRHNFERIRFRENIWSRLIASLARVGLQLDALVNHDQTDTKSIRFEYQSSMNLLDSRGYLTLQEDQKHQMSLNFNRDYFSIRANKRSLNDLAEILGTFSGVDPLIMDWVDRGDLEGPLRLRTRTSVVESGIFHLNSLTASEVIAHINHLCSVKPNNVWQWFRSLFNGCRHRMTREFDWYYKELHHRQATAIDYQYCSQKVRRFWGARRKQAMLQACMESLTMKVGEVREIPLWRLKSFTQTLFDESDNKIDLFHFFGLSNVYIHGSFQAESYTGPFITHFQEGKFRSLSAVDGLMRETHLRAPASVIID